MRQHDTCGSAPSDHVQDTIAFGSMLVFASVMPPLDPDAARTDARRARQPGDGAGGPIDLAVGERPSRRSRKSFDS